MPLILVVDDEAAIRDVLAAFLEDEGYAVRTASNGRVALDLIARERPDLVLTDVMMPEMDGVEVARRLAAAPDLANIPVVLMSAAVAAQVAPPVAAFLPKPFGLDDVLAAVARAFGAV